MPSTNEDLIDYESDDVEMRDAASRQTPAPPPPPAPSHEAPSPAAPNHVAPAAAPQEPHNAKELLCYAVRDADRVRHMWRSKNGDLHIKLSSKENGEIRFKTVVLKGPPDDIFLAKLDLLDTVKAYFKQRKVFPNGGTVVQLYAKASPSPISAEISRSPISAEIRRSARLADRQAALSSMTVAADQHSAHSSQEVAAKKETAEAKKLRQLEKKNAELQKTKAELEKAEADRTAAELAMYRTKDKFTKERNDLTRYHDDLCYFQDMYQKRHGISPVAALEMAQKELRRLYPDRTHNDSLWGQTLG
ncbi:hypothetical protein JCM5296_007093 [Sporobolomyces johnsonii]